MTKPLTASKTIQMKATGHYIPVVLFMICTGCMVPTFESGNEIQQCDYSNESF